LQQEQFQQVKNQKQTQKRIVNKKQLIIKHLIFQKNKIQKFESDYINCMKVLSKIRLSRKSSLKNYQKAKKNKTLLVRAIRKQKKNKNKINEKRKSSKI